MNLSTEQKQTHRYGDHTCGCQEGFGGSEIDWEFEVSRYKLLHLEWVSSEVLLYITRNYIQSLVIEHGERLYKKNNAYIFMVGSLCCIAEIDRTL